MARQARTPTEREESMRAIRAAALDLFAQKGFSAARLEDVAAAAGVAKGTIYLYFSSKQDLLEAIVANTIGASLTKVEQALAASPAPASELLRLLGRAMAMGIQDPDRRRVLHLVLSEGARFPAIADFYHREIISRGLALIRAIIAKGLRQRRIRLRRAGALSAAVHRPRPGRRDLERGVRAHRDARRPGDDRGACRASAARPDGRSE